MVIGIFGENCAGKTTLAAAIRDAVGGEVVSGKDYLRLARSPQEAERRFRERLKDAVRGENILYVISEKALLSFLPEGAVRILVDADLETVKARFRQRMRGSLPAPVERMLERNHGLFDAEPRDFRYDGASADAPAELSRLLERLVQMKNEINEG